MNVYQYQNVITTVAVTMIPQLDERNCTVIPEGHGLMIVLEKDGTCTLQFESDLNWKELHPNIFAPASLEDVRHLHGGGSGVTVFHGIHPSLGSLVMKHGGPKDTQEVFALAVVGQELLAREKSDAISAAEKMRSRIPEFRMIYVSPGHLRHRSIELWNKLKQAVLSQGHANENPGCPKSKVRSDQTRSIKLCRHCYKIGVTFQDNILTMGFDAVNEHCFTCGQKSEGYDAIAEIVRQLLRLQESHSWKFTLAQKTIGDPSVENGAVLHTKGQLTGALLQKLIDEFTDVVRCLQALTRDEEKDVVEIVRRELELTKIENDQDSIPVDLISPDNLSSTIDAFVGFAIKKNYSPISGRFFKLREFGDYFRDKKLILSLAEKVPAQHLGTLLRRGARLDLVFLDLPGSRTSGLDTIELSWRLLVEEAVNCDCKAALERIWTCGLTDAGIHNTFLNSEFLWLFDLGEPSLMPTPAFMTKFLMSFFHTLGMEEDDKGNWVQRFIVVDDMLALTTETKAILPKVYDCFLTVLDGLVKNLFDNDRKVRRLLLRYVVLQLLSDAAFCLERWQSKGGGCEKLGEFDRQLEKWLWRATWDYYICTDVQGRLADILRDE